MWQSIYFQMDVRLKYILRTTKLPNQMFVSINEKKKWVELARISMPWDRLETATFKAFLSLDKLASISKQILMQQFCACRLTLEL